MSAEFPGTVDGHHRLWKQLRRGCLKRRLPASDGVPILPEGWTKRHAVGALLANVQGVSVSPAAQGGGREG